MQEVESVTLDGYRPIARRWPVFTLYLKTAVHEVRYFPDQRAARESGPMSGMADVRRMGGWWWDETRLVAVYVRDGRLYLWLNCESVDLLQEGVVIRRRRDLLLRKRFTVRVGERVVCDVRYSYLDWEQFPDEDIFWYIARSLGTMEGRVRKLLLLEDRLAGRTGLSDEYLRTLDTRVAERLAGREPRPWTG